MNAPTSTGLNEANGILTDPRALAWLRMRAIAKRHAYVMVRSPHRLFDVTLWPLVDVLLFGSLGAYVGSGAASASQRAAAYLTAGVILWHVVYQSQIAVSTGLLEETWTRNLLNLMVTPLTELEYVGGVALFGMVKLVLGVGIMTIAAFAFFSFDVWSLGLGLIPIAAVLLVVGWAISLFVMGIVLRFGTGAEAMAWGIMFVVMPLSGVFYPVSALPAFLRPLAWSLPTTHAFVALRGLVDGTGIDWNQIALAAVTAVALLALGFVFLTRMLKAFRRKGLVTRYS
jgi:ABC-2 type transport system permease protein